MFLIAFENHLENERTLAIFVAFLIVANLGPLSYAFPNLLLWTWAGVAGAEFFLAPRGDNTRPVPPSALRAVATSDGQTIAASARDDEEHLGS